MELVRNELMDLSTYIKKLINLYYPNGAAFTRIIDNQLYVVINLILNTVNIYVKINDIYTLQINIYNHYNRIPIIKQYQFDNIDELYETINYVIKRLQPKMVY
jgi:hypothetical protein